MINIRGTAIATLFLALTMEPVFAQAGFLPAQEPNVPAVNDVERRIERVVNGLLPQTAFPHRYDPKASLSDRMAYFHARGVSIAVVNNYRIEWARGFGVKEWGKAGPVTEATLFQAGSISKPIFALGVMHLVQERKLDLDEDVNRYLTSWKVPANGSWQPRITLRQLLSHTAGLTVHGFDGYLRSEKIPSVVDILNGQAPANTPRVEVNIFPGLQSRYSGGGTTVAQQAVVDVLHQPFPKSMRELVLEPLGMKHSTYEQPLPESWWPAAATAHPSKNRAVEGKWHVYPEMAAAGLWTTPSDLARAGIDLQLTLKGESKRLLPKQRVIEMLTHGVSEEIGIGFFLEGKDKSVRFGHNGVDEGFIATMTMYKDHGMGAVIMINSNEAMPLLDEIKRAIAKEYQWPDYFPKEKVAVKLSPEALDAHVGEYVSKSGLAIRITKENDWLMLKLATQPAIELQPESETKFFITTLNATVTFDKAKEGKTKGLTLRQEGKDTSAQRKPSPALKNRD